MLLSVQWLSNSPEHLLVQPVKIAVLLHVALPCSAGRCCGILPIGNAYTCQGLTTFVERIMVPPVENFTTGCSGLNNAALQRIRAALLMCTCTPRILTDVHP